MNKQTMRDAFWDRIYELAKSDPDIAIVAADLGAPSLDKFRRDFPNQFINVGIAEQNAVLVATGLAIAGKKPIAYAITQFLTLRSYEQFRIYPCGMKLPVTLVGVGAGACYSESGPTHHSIEDLSVMRTLPNLAIYNVSDTAMARQMADEAIRGGMPRFIRLDREIFENLAEHRDLEAGFTTVKRVQAVTVLATGNMVHVAKEIAAELEEQGSSVGVIDVFRFPLNERKLMKELCPAQRLVTIEEHSLRGGMGSYILEILNDVGRFVPVHRIGFDTGNGYAPCYNYGGREAIRRDFGMGKDSLRQILEQCCKEARDGNTAGASK